MGLLIQFSTYIGAQTAGDGKNDELIWEEHWLWPAQPCGITFQSWDPCSPGFRFPPFLWLQCWFFADNFLPNTSITAGLKWSSFRPAIPILEIAGPQHVFYLCVYWHISKVIFKSRDFCLIVRPGFGRGAFFGVSVQCYPLNLQSTHTVSTKHG